MDSVEKMRKLNELTRELKQRGFAESSFEAIQQANQIYGNDAMTQEVAHGIIQNSPHEKMNKDANTNMENNADIINMDKKMNRLSENIESLTAKMNEMIKAINDIDTRLTALKNRPQERIVEKVIERAEQHREEKTEHSETSGAQAEAKADASKPKDEYSMNQRVGNFQSQDVAIDKMFYFGKK